MSTGEGSSAFVRLAEPVAETDIGAAGRLVALACCEDPCFSYVFPDQKTRPRLAQAFFGWCLRHANRYGEVIRTTGSLDGVAVVYRSADLDRHSEDERMATSDYASMEQSLGEEAHRRLTTEFFGRIFATASEALHAHLGDDYWELDLLAVDPAHQGQGIGSSLIRHVNERADQARKRFGLITFNHRNLPLYERHGYQIVAHDTDDPSGVRWWSMRRDKQIS